MICNDGLKLKNNYRDSRQGPCLLKQLNGTVLRSL